MKVCGSTVKLQLKLAVLSTVEVGGIRGVAVKCLDITKNSDCEGSSLDCPVSYTHLTLPTTAYEMSASLVGSEMCIRDR